MGGFSWSFPLSLTINGYITGKNANITGFILVKSIDNAGDTIDQSSKLYFNTTCNINATIICQTCLLTNATFCLSCYTDNKITQQTYYYSTENTCTNNCSLSSSNSYYYYTINHTCLPCTNNCDTCSSDTICITCNLNYYWYSNSTCISKCDTKANYYNITLPINKLSCLTCNTSCFNCLDAFTCLGCSDVTQLLQ